MIKTNKNIVSTVVLRETVGTMINSVLVELEPKMPFIIIIMKAHYFWVYENCNKLWIK